MPPRPPRPRRAQGKFWEMHDPLFEHQDALDDARPRSATPTSLGLDVDRFASDLRAGTCRRSACARTSSAASAAASTARRPSSSTACATTAPGMRSRCSRRSRQPRSPLSGEVRRAKSFSIPPPYTHLCPPGRPALRALTLGPSPGGRGRALRQQDCWRRLQASPNEKIWRQALPLHGVERDRG